MMMKRLDRLHFLSPNPVPLVPLFHPMGEVRVGKRRFDSHHVSPVRAIPQ